MKTHAHHHGTCTDKHCDCGGHPHAPFGSHSHKPHLHPSGEEPRQVWVKHQEHDGAQVISAGGLLHANHQKVRAQLAEKLSLLAKFVQENGGIIGHIKASIETNLVESISVTDTEAMVRQSDTQDILLHIAAIVFALDATLVEAQVKKILDDLTVRPRG